VPALLGQVVIRVWVSLLCIVLAMESFLLGGSTQDLCGLLQIPSQVAIRGWWSAPTCSVAMAPLLISGATIRRSCTYSSTRYRRPDKNITRYSMRASIFDVLLVCF
jgi:hypothetical protein